MMGILGKIFKPIGRVFKKIGKFIKKGFSKLGKFMNKFGILGQIGMMFITSGIANAAFSTLGKMAAGAISKVGTAAASGSAVAKTAHAVLEGVSAIARAPVQAVGTITDTMTTAVSSTLKHIGGKIGNFANKMGVNLPGFDPANYAKITNNGANPTSFNDDVIEATTKVFKDGMSETLESVKDVGRIGHDILPGGPEYKPQMKMVDGKMRDIRYNSNARKQFNIETEALSIKRPEGLPDDLTGFDPNYKAPDPAAKLEVPKSEFTDASAAPQSFDQVRAKPTSAGGAIAPGGESIATETVGFADKSLKDDLFSMKRFSETGQAVAVQSLLASKPAEPRYTDGGGTFYQSQSGPITAAIFSQGRSPEITDFSQNVYQEDFFQNTLPLVYGPLNQSYA